MTKILVHTDVTRYLEFKQIAGSFVYRDGRISKVPSNEMEAIRSPLMGLFEKRRAKKFFEWVQNWKEDDLATHQGMFYVPINPNPPTSSGIQRERSTSCISMSLCKDRSISRKRVVNSISRCIPSGDWSVSTPCELAYRGLSFDTFSVSFLLDRTECHPDITRRIIYHLHFDGTLSSYDMIIGLTPLLNGLVQD